MNRYRQYYGDLQEDPRGELVYYSDHKKAVNLLLWKIKKLQFDLREYKKIVVFSEKGATEK